MTQKNTNISIPRPLKMYPNWDFWYETILSGNPDRKYAFNMVRCWQSDRNDQNVAQTIFTQMNA
jgi:hypothetical protein